MSDKKHPINGLLESSMQNLRNLVDVDTIIGEPIKADGVTIIPVSKVNFGMAGGGSDFANVKSPDLFAGGTGAGVTIQPMAFLVIKGGSVQLLQMASENNTVDRVVNMVPDVVDKITGLISKFGAEKEESPVAGYEVVDSVDTSAMPE